MTEPILVVDIGTTSCSAMIVSDDRTEHLTEPGGGPLVSWPSAVLVRDGEPVVGTRADKHGHRRPTAFADEFKLSLGRGRTIPLNGQEHTPQRLVEIVLQVCRDAAERWLGTPVGRVLLTVPATFAERGGERREMIAAAESVGFGLVELLEEPVATANAPLEGPSPTPGQTVLVYDWGGGTFDTALVRIGAAGRQTVLQVGGLPDCGGRDVDQLVVTALIKAAGLADPDLHSRERLRWAREVKHELTRPDPALDEFDDGDSVVTPQLTVEQLTGLAAPLVQRTITACEELLRAADVAPSAVDGLILSGGASRLPGVGEALDAALGIDLCPVRSPELAVVEGAARWVTRADERRATAVRPAFGTEPLSWQFPGGAATVVRWDVPVGASFAKGADLGVVRLTGGALWRLHAGRGGRMLAQHARPDDQVFADQWLVTVEADRSELGAALREPDLLLRRPLGTPKGAARFGTAMKGWSTPQRGAADVGFSEDGRCMAIEPTASAVVTWDLIDGRRMNVLPTTAENVVLSPDGRLLATVVSRRGGGHEASLWSLPADEASQPRCRVTIVSRSGLLRFAPHGDLFAVHRGDNRLAVFRSSDGREIGSTASWRSDDPAWQIALGRSVLYVGVGKDRHLVGGSDSWERCEELSSPVAFSPDGAWLVDGAGGANPSARVRRVKDLGSVKAQLIGRAAGPLSSVAFDLAGRQLALGWSSGWVSLVETKGWTTRHVFAHGPETVDTVRFSPNGARLVAAGAEGVSVWALTDAA